MTHSSTPSRQRRWTAPILAAVGVLTDGVNTTSGRFITTGTGFDVIATATTLVGDTGNDPAQNAATTGIDAVTSPVMPSGASGSSEGPPLPVTVLSADRQHLDVQGGGVRLTFARNGPARTPSTPPPISSAPGR